MPRPTPSTSRLRELLGPSLLDASWVRRLGRISFLGTLDEHPASRSSSTRLDHSLAVAELGVRVGQSLELESTTLRTLAAACLLHDIGHFPLSHAAEAGFEAALGATHHTLCAWIILGDGAIPRQRSLRPTLEAAGIDAEAVWALMSSHTTGESLGASLAPLLTAPINLDTLDGIPRAARSFGLRGPQLPRRLFELRAGRLWIPAASIEAMDRFWQLKERVYSEVINLPSNILYEAELSERVRGRVDATLFKRFLDFGDDELKRLLDTSPWTRDRFTSLDGSTRLAVHAATAGGLRRIRKRYYVDPQVRADPGGLPCELWPRRWVHHKETVYLHATSPASQLELAGLPLTEGPDL